MEEGKLADSSWTKRVNEILSLFFMVLHLRSSPSPILSFSPSPPPLFGDWFDSFSSCFQEQFSCPVFVPVLVSLSLFFLSSCLFQEALRPLLVVYGLISLFDFLSCNDLPTKRGQADRTYSNNRPSPTWSSWLASVPTRCRSFDWLWISDCSPSPLASLVNSNCSLLVDRSAGAVTQRGSPALPLPLFSLFHSSPSSV